jgi:hypothetical protein
VLANNRYGGEQLKDMQVDQILRVTPASPISVVIVHAFILAASFLGRQRFGKKILFTFCSL